MNQSSLRVAAATGCALMIAALTPVCAGSAHASAGAVGRAAAPLAGVVRIPWLSGPVVVAHRGASQVAPENTLAAVDAADRQGFTWVENDVQQTRDGKLVVMHDPTLARTTNARRLFPQRAPWRVRDFTAAEIARLDAGSWFGKRFASERVPTLGEFLRRMEDHDLRLLLEIKSPQLYPGIEARIVKELSGAGWLDRGHARRRLVVQSFSASSVQTVRRLVPAVRTGFLGNPPLNALASYARFADQINPQLSKVNAQYVAAVHRLRGVHGRRMEVFAWDVPLRNYSRIASAYGFDGVIV
ncbi:glycerophosphodiester phosphodiesterase [Streptomyces sp. CB02923]|uniref:glycerophosphodiester phosphodiesterase n=1 Tax=Streptomyces sp. CB02923 TaxID=1718985 RepID=UPI00093ADE40|nr:glycerophosphodiester phosphodiesterase family protein [Streptomyces sp. CB02923]OKI07313.1 glycerophosphodiester phosphodiesterase [Streptomyces sp. CB02923]